MGEIFISSSSTPRFPTTTCCVAVGFVANAIGRPACKQHNGSSIIIAVIVSLFARFSTGHAHSYAEHPIYFGGTKPRTVVFANHAVDALDNVLHPLLVGRNILLPSYLSFRARPRICRCGKQAARLQNHSFYRAGRGNSLLLLKHFWRP